MVLDKVMLKMTRIGIISDTHQDRVSEGFKRTIERIFKDVEIIIHAGDMTALTVCDYLSNWDLRAVRGNMDEYELSAHLPAKRIEVIGGVRIGITHGSGGPYGIENIVLNEFDGVDVIVFGHSHIPYHERKGDVTLFNPGAFRGISGRPGTVGIMEIHKEVFFKHINLTDV